MERGEAEMSSSAVEGEQWRAEGSGRWRAGSGQWRWSVGSGEWAVGGVVGLSTWPEWSGSGVVERRSGEVRQVHLHVQGCHGCGVCVCQTDLVCHPLEPLRSMCKPWGCHGCGGLGSNGRLEHFVTATRQQGGAPVCALLVRLRRCCSGCGACVFQMGLR